MKTAKGLLSFLLVLFLLIGMFSMPVFSADYYVKCLASDADVNASWSYSFYYEQWGNYEFYGYPEPLDFIEGVEMTLPEEANGAFELDVLLNGYDTENYVFRGWKINGVDYCENAVFRTTSFLSDLGEEYLGTVSGVYLPYEGSGTWSGKPLLELYGIMLTDIVIEPIFEAKNSIAFTPSVDMASGQAELGAIESLVYIDGDAALSTWTLTTSPAAGYQLAYIMENSTEEKTPSEDGKTVTWDVTAADLVYTAVFEAATMHIRSIDYGPTLNNTGRTGYVSSAAPAAGQRTGFSIAAYVPSDIAGNTPFHYTLYAGSDTSGQPLAAYDRIEATITHADNIFGVLLTVDPMPGNLTQMTLEARLGNGAAVTRTFDVTVNPSGTTALTYLDVPGGGLNYETAGDPGPAVYDAAAYADPDTGALTLYLGTHTGVAASSGGAFAKLGDLTGDIVALGTDEAGTLTAVQAAEEEMGHQNDVYRVYQYNGGTWTSSDTEGHSIGVDSVNNSLRVGLVMGADDVWLQDAHWTGTAWEAHSYGFNSFWRADQETAYAGSADGVYVYRGGAWTKLDGISGPRYITAGCSDETGAELILTDSYSPKARVTNQNVVGSVWQAAASGTGAAETKMDLSTLADPVQGGSRYVGVGADGTLYAITRGRLYENQSTSAFFGSSLFKFVNGAWQHQIVGAFDDPAMEDDDPSTKYRPDCIRYIVNPCDKLTLFLGDDGAIYAQYGTSTITFDAGEGGVVDPLKGEIMSPVTAPEEPEREGFNFAGWYHDQEFTREWAGNYMPGRDITLYAKWEEKGSEAEELEAAKTRAQKELRTQYKKYNEADYAAEDWKELKAAYADGLDAILEAETKEAVTAALNAAVAAMQAIEPINTNTVTVAVSMDADTLGLGYLLEPTLVTVDKGTPVSVVITELLNANAAEKYPEVSADGLIEKTPELEDRTPLYPWASSGSVKGNFYLSDVYFPEQTGYKISPAIQAYIDEDGEIEVLDGDKNGKYLSEFDYLNTAGWMYSVGDKDSGGAEFPGLGASGWMLSEGEVVRWQFTLVGYGADLGANNTDWGGESLIDAGDKSALTWKVAELRREFSDGTLKANDVYNDALAVLTDAEAAQEAVDAALAALNGETFTEPVTAVTLDKTEASLTVGKTLTLKATVEPENASDPTVTWESSDPEVAAVDKNGKVTGVKAGSATITAKAGDQTASCAVKVSDEAPAEAKVELVGGSEEEPFAQAESAVETVAGENGEETLRAVVTVRAEQPCVVIVQKDGGYERLAAEKNGDAWNFVQEDYSEDMVFYVAVKGDYNGDGEFGTNDLAIANRDIVNDGEIGPLKALIMGADAGEELEARHLAILNRAWLADDLTW